MIDVMIFGSLAASAWGSLSLATGSLLVTCSLPRETKIQPVLPSNLMPFGNSVLTTIFTPLAYSASVRNFPCTSQRPFCGNSAVPQTSRSEEHTSELQSLRHLVCRLLLE